ncbi:MAG: DUF308 domain-containing protein [Paraprevotella sp.]|nr:DUF308 domain-containing protein [Paraprevotella sp.]
MRVINSYVFRSVCTILIGILLVSNPEMTSPLLVQIIGVLFFLSGLVSLASYVWVRWRSKEKMKPFFPIVGLGSFLFGMFLFFFPGYFILYLMWMLGGLFVIAGINQMAALISYRKVMPLSWPVFVVPSLVLLAGVFIIARPFESASLPFIVLGICSICYGISEFVNGVRLHRWLKRAERLTFAKAEEVTE